MTRQWKQSNKLHTYSETNKRIKDITAIGPLNVPLSIERIIALVRLAGKLGWTTTIRQGMKYKIEENLPC